MAEQAPTETKDVELPADDESAAEKEAQAAEANEVYGKPVTLLRSSYRGRKA